ncbi:hypothetical protein LOK49_LG04G00855 [Camellia lanceoleosa]|uniref:Uncharacterized protein n=2 Tax=Camellia lanceoleosa TaxID=1840588 RepID=A0ACC0HW54_9ERIC|nr:hypothetical protein LOK49_LG04G00867 [Camellia lanceoleosa]KAI8018201.1 hypothetical protein LOK49_LG04G00855 [Camellia lanceoleosa]
MRNCLRLQIMILSDSEKRTHYDRYLLSQRMRVQRCSEQVSRRIVVGSGYFDVLESDFYSAIHAAYHGPVIESMDLLPGCFEAEERSACETPQVLHLVSGRDLFGMISLADKVPELSQSYNEKLSSFASRGSGLCQAIENISRQTNSGSDDIGIYRMQATEIDYHASYA